MDDRQFSGDLINALGHQAQITQQGAMRDNLAELARAQRGVAKCPWCGGPIPKLGVEVCMHCSREIGWAKWMCCKPDEVDLYLPIVAEYEQKAAIEAKRESISRLTALTVVVLAIVVCAGLVLTLRKSNREEDPPYKLNMGNKLNMGTPSPQNAGQRVMGGTSDDYEKLLKSERLLNQDKSD